jgi:hypothetical protein
MMEGAMKRFDVAAMCLATICLAVHMPLQGAQAQDDKVTRIRMTIGDLRAQGIAISPNAPPFPNSCRASGNARLSVSDALLSHFRARGFPLESVCLGFSSHVRFDPETGRQLPLAFVPELPSDGALGQEFPLNLPSCFRNGVSHHECDYKFESWFGTRLDRRDLATHRESARRFDTMVRAHIERNRISGVFFRLARSDQRRLPDWLQSTYYEWILASNALARGYGYALHGPEGEDPEIETVNLSTYRKKRGGSSLWSD